MPRMTRNQGKRCGWVSRTARAVTGGTGWSKAWNIRSAARTLFAPLLLATLALGLAVPASLLAQPALAQSREAQGQGARGGVPTPRGTFLRDWREEFRIEMLELRGLKSTGDCIEAIGDAGRQPVITVFGVPRNETQVSPETRGEINSALETSIPGEYGTPADADIIKGFLPQRGGPNAAARAINRLYGADMVLTARIERPAPTTIRLAPSLTIFAPGESEVCTTRRFKPRFIDLATLGTAPPPPRRLGEFHDLSGALVGALAAVTRELQRRGDTIGENPRVTYRLDHPFGDEACPIDRYVDDGMTRAYAAVREGDATNEAIGAQSYPPLARLSEGEGAEAALVTLGFAPAANDLRGEAAGVPVLSLTIGTPGTAARAYTVLVPEGLREGYAAHCTGTTALSLEAILQGSGASLSHAFALRPTSPRFAPGDALEVVMEAGEPVYAFCWIVGDDGEAQPVYPFANAQMRAPFPTGTPYAFPTAFGFERRIVREGRSLFGCFTSVSPFPRELKGRWVDMANSPVALPQERVRALLDEFRAMPITGETYAWIDHRGAGETAILPDPRASGARGRAMEGEGGMADEGAALDPARLSAGGEIR